MTAIKELARGYGDLLDRLPRGDLAPYHGRERVASIVADLNLLIEGWRPSEADLALAAHIERWAVIDGVDAGKCLVGLITRHPTVSDRVLSRTSGIVFVAKNLWWVRTIGRFYELGMPSDPDQTALLRGLPSI